MDKLLTQKQKAQAYRAILEPERSALEMVEFVKGMTAAEVAGVLQYAEAEKARATELVDRIADNNPDNERNYSANNNYRDAERVIKIIGLVKEAGSNAGELAKVAKERDAYAERIIEAKTKEFERHYEGLVRFGKDYLKETRFTAGNLMELMVYVEELMAPVILRALEKTELTLRENPGPDDGGEYRNLVMERELDAITKSNPEASRQAAVYDLLNAELQELRHQREAAILDASHKSQTIKQRVKDFFEFLTGWDGRNNPRILSEPDFERLVDWITFYCENDFTPPIITKPIYRKNTTRGIIVHAFKDFFTKTYSGYMFPDSLFELIKACFFELRNDNIENLKKTKEPVNYRKLQKYNG